jgi:hypothetical protein
MNSDYVAKPEWRRTKLGWKISLGYLDVSVAGSEDLWDYALYIGGDRVDSRLLSRGDAANLDEAQLLALGAARGHFETMAARAEALRGAACTEYEQAKLGGT